MTQKIYTSMVDIIDDVENEFGPFETGKAFVSALFKTLVDNPSAMNIFSADVLNRIREDRQAVSSDPVA